MYFTNGWSFLISIHSDVDVFVTCVWPNYLALLILITSIFSVRNTHIEAELASRSMSGEWFFVVIAFWAIYIEVTSAKIEQSLLMKIWRLMTTRKSVKQRIDPWSNPDFFKFPTGPSAILLDAKSTKGKSMPIRRTITRPQSPALPHRAVGRRFVVFI